MDYSNAFLTEQDRMIIRGIRGFVEQEIMPVRQQIDDDKDHVIVRQILQKLYDLGLMRISLSQESDESATARGYYDL
jgi:alkylation response protein AidB-like acyl-CoA dehydrogenase